MSQLFRQKESTTKSFTKTELETTGSVIENNALGNTPLLKNHNGVIYADTWVVCNIDEKMPHQGRHHDYVLDQMKRNDMGAAGDQGNILKGFEDVKNPDMLRIKFWSGK